MRTYVLNSRLCVHFFKVDFPCTESDGGIEWSCVQLWRVVTKGSAQGVPSDGLDPPAVQSFAASLAPLRWSLPSLRHKTPLLFIMSISSFSVVHLIMSDIQDCQIVISDHTMTWFLSIKNNLVTEPSLYCFGQKKTYIMAYVSFE